MEKEVQEDILSVLLHVIRVLQEQQEKDILILKDMSNHTIHDASIYQDIDSVQIAIATYALYKLFDRGVEIPAAYYKKILEEFDLAYSMLQKDKFGDYNEHIENVFYLIKKIDQSALIYIQEVMDKARVTKGSKLFEHGLSAKRAAQIMGISEWELLSYLGKTEIIDKYTPGGLHTKKRLQQALQLFGAL